MIRRLERFVGPETLAAVLSCATLVLVAVVVASLVLASR
jgi:hypothetical protein